MMKRTFTIAAASFALLAGGWMSVEHADGPDEMGGHDMGMQDMGMPDMSAMMEMMAKSAEPVEQHEILEKMAGEWKVIATFQMGPGEPNVSRGTSTNTMVLGGRQLLTRAEMKMSLGEMEMDFSGIGIMGYDRMTEQFQSSWADTMGTGQLIQTGTIEDGKIVVVGTIKTVMGETTIKNITTFVDGGYNLDFWESGEMTGGELVHTGTIEYRK